jgi:K+-transporting ATPase ATPase C chain
MAIFSELGRAIRLLVFLWILVAILYPLSLLGFGQIALPYQANGSLIKNAQGEYVGSALIGQLFQSEGYFWSRPSAVNYSAINPSRDEENLLKTGISGGSNLAPSAAVLKERITASLSTLESLKAENKGAIADLIYSSGSGLDPHINPAAAQVQIERIAQARNIDTAKLQTLIQQNIDHRFLSIFGEPGVNVLKLNLALDQLSS